MRVLHQPLCLSRQARRIRQVGGWTSVGFLNPSQMVQGAAWWASAPALPLGRQQLGEGLAKGIHNPLLYMRIKRGRNCFSLVCPGFIHRWPTYCCRPIPLCQQPSLGVNSTTLWLSLLVWMCASEGTRGMMRGAVQGSLRSWWAAWLWSLGREDYWIHLKKLPFSRWLASTSSLFLTLLFILYSIIFFLLAKMFSSCIFTIY